MSDSSNDRLQIGFDRFIPLRWSALALQIRAGSQPLDALESELQAAGGGRASKIKNRTVLKGLWIEPRIGTAEFADRGVAIWNQRGDTSLVPLSWGMAITAYPFFGRVVETIGRLTGIQGECSSMEVHRRISEVYGQRETTTRAVNRIIQTLADWCVIEVPGKARTLRRRGPAAVSDDELTAWLIEAAVQYAKKALPLSSMSSSTVLFPFSLEGSLALAASHKGALELRSEGARGQMLSVRNLA